MGGGGEVAADRSARVSVQPGDGWRSLLPPHPLGPTFVCRHFLVSPAAPGESRASQSAGAEAGRAVCPLSVCPCDGSLWGSGFGTSPTSTWKRELGGGRGCAAIWPDALGSSVMLAGFFPAGTRGLRAAAGVLVDSKLGGSSSRLLGSVSGVSTADLNSQ